MVAHGLREIKQRAGGVEEDGFDHRKQTFNVQRSILKFCAHDQPEKDDSEKRKRQPGKHGWDAPKKEQRNVGGTGGSKRRAQPELIAQHSDCDIIKPRFIEATLI